MNSLMISIKPKWCELIASGKKTIEVRKTKPRCDVPFRCYIYCTNDRKIMLERSNYDKSIYLNSNIYYPHKMNCSLNGKVIGEFICNDIYDFKADNNYEYGIYDIDDDLALRTCLENGRLWDYGKGKPLYGWDMSDFVIYDEPRELSEFHSERSVYEIKDGKLSYTGITRPPQSWCYVEVEE